MEEKGSPRIPIAGIVYAEIAYWFVIVGIVVAITGSLICLISNSYVDNTLMLDYLWEGENVETIWISSSELEEPPRGHWYLDILSYGDGIAMLGIAICSLGALFGMWGAFIAMLRSRERFYAGSTRLYLLFAGTVAVILTLSALGIISLES